MAKSKVGAEPKKRIKHVFCQREGIHEGIHRDEPGWFESNRHPYCFGYGYFFHRGSSLAERLTPEYIKEHWDEEGWYGSLKNHCMAIIDRKRKIAIIKVDTEYAWDIERGLPSGYSIYKTDEVIPVYDITDPKNKKILINMYAKYLIKKYLETFYNEYKVLNTISKQIPEHTYISSSRAKYLEEIKGLVEKYNRLIPKHKPLCNKVIHISKYNVEFPSINDILNDKLFTEEQKEYFAKCKFYTKYIYNKPNNYTWKDVENNWNKLVDDELLWQDDIAKKAEENTKALYKRFKECKAKVTKNLQAKIKEFVNGFGAKNVVDYWRKNNLKYNTIDYKDCYIKNGYIQWYDSHYTLNNCFDNIQLKLKGDYVITSKGVSVPLNLAIKLFNKLYVKYFIDKTTDSVVFCNNINICCYKVRFIRYKEKVKDNGEPLGYKEWLIQIGCHSLWFDDVKDFARYYNLQDKLSFPLDKTTEECRNNNLIHLITDKND